MKLRIEVTQEELKQLVYDRMAQLLGEVPFDPKDVKIETKSQQNYRSEWESNAGFRAVIEVSR